MFSESAALIFCDGSLIGYHLPHGRTSCHIPDSQDLWDKIWFYRNNLGGVAHTHPGTGSSSPSDEDVTTYRAIERALGKLLLWPIITSDDVTYWCWNIITEQYVEAKPDYRDSARWKGVVYHLRELSKEKPMKKIHYAGAVRTPRTRILPGWAACCSGVKAEKIRAEGNNTTNPSEVTCASCKRMMAQDETITEVTND